MGPFERNAVLCVRDWSGTGQEAVMGEAPAVAIDDRQRVAVAAIESGAATGDRRPLRRIDTHMSHLFLGPERVYKLKRSVRHAFGDMSSIEARRKACEAELEVNRRLAPELYERVLPVVRDPGGDLRVGGEGQIEDWVVAMQRFPDEALFAEMADAGVLGPELIGEAAAVIARFHASLPPLEQAGHAVDYRRITEGLRRTEAEGAAALGVTPASESLFDALDRATVRLSPVIEARREAGWVRRGHGDLHLRNICVFNGRATPFDALEFDPALASADVLYDLSFLLMDLRARGLDDLANVAMNTYWDASGQPEEALVLLPLFMALRAAVRMAVAFEAGDLVESEAYRVLGRRLLQLSPPSLLALGGLSGTGKSTVARAVASGLPGCCGARVLRTDTIRKRLAKIAPDDRLAEEAYGFGARARVYDVLADDARKTLAAGVSVIADATFREASLRAEIEGAAEGFDFRGLWLSASAKVRAARVALRRGDASDATVETALGQVEPHAVGAWEIVDADRPLASVIKDVRHRAH